MRVAVKACAHKASKRPGPTARAPCTVAGRHSLQIQKPTQRPVRQRGSAMFRNYLTVALRNIVRHKLYSFINIAGLAVGLACVIFILLFIRDELSYDKWIHDTQNLYRVEKTYYGPGRDPFDLAVLPFPMAAAMRDGIPEVAKATRLDYTFMTLFAGDRQFREHIAEVDPNFFQVIKLPLAKGDPAGVFNDPESVVVSESVARKYFGSADVIGKVIKTTANCAV